MENSDDYSDDNDSLCDELYDLEYAEALPDTEYKVITNNEILQLMEEEVSFVMYFLSSSRNTATTILRHYNWKSLKLKDDWLSGDELIQTMAHYLQTPAPKHETSLCKTCLSKSVSNHSSCCGEHYYCNTCWSKYISDAVNQGPSCLALKCPEPSCRALVSDDMVVNLTTKATVEKLNLHGLRAFVQNRRNLRLCPAPGCDYAVSHCSGSGGASLDVICKCGHEFCFQCGEEVHRPVDCETVEKWSLKNSSEGETVNWIIANTKPYPKCKIPIQSHGQLIVKCRRPCGLEFCWRCFAHYPRCAGGCKDKLTDKLEDEILEMNLKMAKQYTDKYTHYYTRWAESGVSTAKAVTYLRYLENGNLDWIIPMHNLMPAGQMRVLVEAWQQIVVSRRFLRWSYVYRYYMSDDSQAKEFFEHHQGLAEKSIEWLHKCAEMDIKVFVDSREAMKDEFLDYLSNLAHLTLIARNYSSSLIEDLEKRKPIFDIVLKEKKDLERALECK